MPKQKRIYTVGQINQYINLIFKEDYLLSGLYMKGEVSNCKYHSSGHIYFSLKDETGTMSCVMFLGDRSAGLKFRMQDGQSVIVRGSIKVYRNGQCQMYAREITQDGTGSLYEQYEQLKQRLYEEGLFEFEHKKPIPKYPKRVGIVTAATGAAIQDICNIARRRNPYVQLILYPAKVQGEGAAATIVKGIRCLDQKNVDVIIVGRGGGSLEDLWAFNEECVARAIYEARTPIISGTGHEVDTTIADYAADLRAPTPSAACELAIPDYIGIVSQTAQLAQRMEREMHRKLDQIQQKYLEYRLRMQHLNPVTRLEQQKQYMDQLRDQMEAQMQQKLQTYKHQLALLTERLHGSSPTARLVHGYGYIERDGKPVTGREQVKPGDTLQITVHDGRIQATVAETEPAEQIRDREEKEV